jgi:TRAP-type mannitol/chloroaromatic compound transport system permease small subunit
MPARIPAVFVSPFVHLQIESTMQGLLLAVDRFNTWIGQLFGWLVLGLTLFVSYEVFSRYVLGAPHAWAFDFMNMLYGGLFMMAGAYTLSKNGHVRGDVLYGFFPPRLQAGLDLALYFLFFFPGVIAMFWAGYYYAAESWAISEHSNITADGPPIYPFKAIIPIAGFCLLLQGVVEIIRCIGCLREGKWPTREHDVEEVDVDKLKDMVHVKDEDIARLDVYVTGQTRQGARK